MVTRGNQLNNIPCVIVANVRVNYTVFVQLVPENYTLCLRNISSDRRCMRTRTRRPNYSGNELPPYRFKRRRGKHGTDGVLAARRFAL